MLRSCLFCHAPFALNDQLEHFNVGRRLAFDPARGRLWAVCPVCARWSLAPIEERWEALDELERLVRDRGKLLIQTDNIGLLRAGELEIVRVGRAELREEAWWRYGRAIVQRRLVAWVAGAADVGLMVAASTVLPGMGAGLISSTVKWARFGSNAWKGEVFCERCGRPTTRLSFSAAGKLRLIHGPDGLPALRGDCGSCAWRLRDGSLQWSGAHAERTLRRIMAYQNAAGASRRRVEEAAQTIARAGSAEALIAHAAERRPQIREFQKSKYRTAALALEIAANDDMERRLLELEAKALELRWQEEEALAAISDGELTPLARLDQLVRRIRQPA